MALSFNPLTGQLDLTNVPSPILLKEVGTPASFPPAGTDYLYFKADHNLYRMDSTGAETKVGGGTDDGYGWFMT